MFEQIFQVSHNLEDNDGVSNIIFDSMTIFDKKNIPNKLLSYSINTKKNYKNKWDNVINIKKLITSKTFIIFHFAMQTSLTYIISNIKCPKVLLYHNITPPVFFKKYGNNDLKNILISGYKELFFMSSYFPYSWGVSEYNCSQLREAGFPRTDVANPPINFNRYSGFKNNVRQNNKINIIFIGRISPHKCQKDVIKAFYYYYRINPNSNLTLVGSYKDFENYKNDLEKLAFDLKLPVNITGIVSFEKLISIYQNANLFLCMSEHEGFCLPIIEAMYFNIPVLAFDSSAVTETVGDAGIIFKQKHFPSVGHLINEVLTNIPLKEKMIEKGIQRALYYNKDNVSQRNIKLIEDYAMEMGL